MIDLLNNLEPATRARPVRHDARVDVIEDAATDLVVVLAAPGLFQDDFSPLPEASMLGLQGDPQPPPPGVSIRRTSPAFSWIVHLSGRRSARFSSPPGRSQFSPTAPGSPPAKPHG